MHSYLAHNQEVGPKAAAYNTQTVLGSLGRWPRVGDREPFLPSFPASEGPPETGRSPEEGQREEELGTRERCLLHDRWSGRTEGGRDRKGHGDLRHGKSAALARHRGVGRWSLRIPKPTSWSVLPGPPPRPWRAAGEPTRRFISLLNRVSALLENSIVALGENVFRALFCGQGAATLRGPAELVLGRAGPQHRLCPAARFLAEPRRL